MRFLLDTNIIIDYLLGNLPELVSLEPRLFGISVITEAELLRFPGLSRSEIIGIENVLGACNIITIDSNIARRAALIGRTRKTKLPDLLIAATALENNIALITKNVKDFRGITGLVLRSKM